MSDANDMDGMNHELPREACPTVVMSTGGLGGKANFVYDCMNCNGP